jgi:16S rRNA G527 N7-methylase RsmG
MRIRVPPKKIRERFLLIYELEDCQKAVNFLTAYYGVRRLRIVLDGRRAGNGNIASYFENKAYFTKRGLNKQTVLHELCHHLIEAKGWKLPSAEEEREANEYAKLILKSQVMRALRPKTQGLVGISSARSP